MGRRRAGRRQSADCGWSVAAGGLLKAVGEPNASVVIQVTAKWAKGFKHRAWHITTGRYERYPCVMAMEWCDCGKLFDRRAGSTHCSDRCNQRDQPSRQRPGNTTTATVTAGWQQLANEAGNYDAFHQIMRRADTSVRRCEACNETFRSETAQRHCSPGCANTKTRTPRTASF
jgi:hypothetical protein